MRCSLCVLPLAALALSIPAATDEDRVIKHWLGVAQEMADKQEITLAGDASRIFELHRPSVFRHTQPVRGDDIGSMFIWKTKQGRPAAMGVFFSWSDGRKRWVMEEFHSLHDQPIQKSVQGKVTWTSNETGLKWRPVPKAPSPVGATTRMRIQARQMSRRFEAYTEKTPGDRNVLRNVPEPVYEYKDVAAGIEYGSVMVSCQGTDTELLLLLEARKSDGKLSWYYALAPFTDYGLFVKLPDETLWQSPKGQLGEDGKAHYWNFVEQRPKPDFEK